MAEPEAPQRELSTSRLLALADGIFAIAMTLLVFEIKVPVGALSSPELADKLAALLPKFACCGLTFLTLGFSWIGHHNQYVAIRRTDRSFLWINVAFLCAIALVPFSSALLGEYPAQQLAVAIYAFNLAVAGALLYWHWAYATHGHRLVSETIPDTLVQQTKRRVMIAPATYTLAILLSFVNVKLSLALCLALPLYFMIPGRVDKHWTPGSGPTPG